MQRKFAIPADGETFDIALGVGEFLQAFAYSFSNPFAYYFKEWPDQLITDPLDTSSLLQLMNRNAFKQAFPIVMDRIKNREVSVRTIRFNLQGLTDPHSESLTMFELGFILKEDALTQLTRFYEGASLELETMLLDKRLSNLGFPRG